VIRRFYLELVAHRRRLPVEDRALGALDALTKSGLRDALGELREIARSGPDSRTELRVAAVVELWPDSRDRVISAIERATEALARTGVSIDLWPQLADDRTRFLNTATAATWRRVLLPIVDEIAKRTFPIEVGLALDVEPTQSFLHATWRLGGLGRSPSSARPMEVLADTGAIAAGFLRQAAAGERGFSEITALARHVRDSGLSVHTAVMPRAQGPTMWAPLRRILLGCPDLDADGHTLWDRPAAMCYPTMLRHFAKTSRALERTSLTNWLQRHGSFCDEHRLPRAAVLGLLSHGVLGDEPAYDRIEHFKEDVETAASAGFEDLAFYSLEGLLYGDSGVPPREDLAPTVQGHDFRAWARAALAPISAA
jgi:hypothetical protein